ncbi:unnamed protein product [Xylocopa violacea]|uniref:Uncharacterized protein n=1 Tax=Xylocopa violacea TaxID=135666 RepID=A0ABP1NT89_XYLVO
MEQMAMDISDSDKHSSQPLKKRKLYNALNDINENIQQENKENTNIPTQNVTTSSTPNKNIDINKETSTNNSIKIETDLNLDLATSAEDTADCNNDNKMKSKSRNSTISIRKIEDLCGTPKKNVTLQDLENIRDIKTENISSPQIFSPNINTNSMEWLSQSAKILSGTPTKCKEEKQNFCDSTPNRRKRRKFSPDIGDYDELSEVLKSDLCNTDLNDMEQIDMLHDLSSVMDFEDNKIITNFFCSTTNNTMQNEQELELSKDPEIDPLFIADNDETNTTSENTGNIELKQKNLRLRVTQEEMRDNTTNADTQESHDDEDINNDIKDILGILDIDEESEVEEADELPKNLIHTLYNIQVKLIHKVPPQHKVEHTAGSKSLTKIEKKLFLRHGPIKSGQYTPTEDNIIMDNWEAFCEVHDWNPKCVQPFLSMKRNNKFYIRSMEERQKFVQFLANGLPWRTLFSVYNRFKCLHKKHERSFKRYTAKEDMTILSHIKDEQNRKQMHRKFAELSNMLSRSRHSIWKHYQVLKKEQQQVPPKVNWTLPLIGRFIKVFMNITLSENVRDLKDAIIPKPVWKKLEQKLKIDHNQLKKFWVYRLHMQLFCPEPIYLNDIKIKLIEYVYGKGIAHIREIVWSNITKYFDGITSVFLCKVFLRLVEAATAKMGTNCFLDIIEYLYHEKIENIKNELTDKFLPRLSYKNGKVNVIDKDLTSNINN